MKDISNLDILQESKTELIHYKHIFYIKNMLLQIDTRDNWNIDMHQSSTTVYLRGWEI